MENIEAYIACACCGYQTLEEKYVGEICDICFWEDNKAQEENPDLGFGPNKLATLREAQQNYLEIGACDTESTDVVRQPTISDTKDPFWEPLPVTN